MLNKYFLGGYIKYQPLRDYTVVNLSLLTRDGPQGGCGSALTLPFCREGTGCLGATGHKRQQGAVEGLAPVAERMNLKGIRTEGRGLPAQGSFSVYTMLPLVGEMAE